MTLNDIPARDDSAYVYFINAAPIVPGSGSYTVSLAIPFRWNRMG